MQFSSNHFELPLSLYTKSSSPIVPLHQLDSSPVTPTYLTSSKESKLADATIDYLDTLHSRYSAALAAPQTSSGKHLIDLPQHSLSPHGKRQRWKDSSPKWPLVPQPSTTTSVKRSSTNPSPNFSPTSPDYLSLTSTPP